MGMSIDKCIDYFLRSYAIDDTDDARQHNEIMEYTIDTMRRYQKIEQIVTNILNNTAKEDERYVYDYLGDIIEVIEDGNDTTNTENH